MKETVHVTFCEDDEAISQSSTEGDAINFNENRSFPDDEFLEPKSKVTQCYANIEYFLYIPSYQNTTPTDSPILQDSVSPREPPEFTNADDHLAFSEHDHFESSDNIEPAKIQDNHIELVNIISEPLAGIITRSRVRDSEAASAHEYLYVNFLSEMEPKKLIEALEEEGWIIATQEELNQFERNKDVYVQQPPGFESSEFPNHVCKLDKALYGLKQAPRAWYETLSKFLIQHKFVRGTIDNTLFTYKTKSDVIIVQIYVDDIIFGSTSTKLSKQFGKLMTTKYEMSMMGELTYFLGFQIKQDFKGIFICQEKYVKDLLKKYDLADSASVKCPMLPRNNLGPDESGVSVNDTLFKDMIGSLMYLIGSRLDIQFSTCFYAMYQVNPKESHLVAVKRIFSAKKQSSAAMSSAKAEYVDVIGCYAQVLWIKSQLVDYDVLYDKVLILCDNTSAIVIFNNPVLHSRTKHIDISNALTIQPSAIYVEYLKEFWYTAEVDEATKTITFLLSSVENH
ncbi:retrovirus-related pol polyprotein from transposon TNT 1-94 [Tanacetum coccineum]